MRPLTGLILLALLAGSACGSPPGLADTHDSPEALASAVLDALARKDRAALDALALNETEFRDHIWPALPAARPERNLPFSYVWGDLKQKSDAALGSTLARHGGRRYELTRVTFAGETQYGDYRVMREATFHVRYGDDIAESVRVCGSMVEKDGEWKVFSYVVDE